MQLILFDVDGTLVDSGDQIQSSMAAIISKLVTRSDLDLVLGIVGGGNYDKIKWQLGDSLRHFKYIFAECGSVIYIDNVLVEEKNMLDYCKEDRMLLNLIIKNALLQICQMDIIYHGNQIDFRSGLIYISPPGIQATSYERTIFMELDKKHHLRTHLINRLAELDSNNIFEFALGGAVGIAMHPRGWNKSQVIDSIDKYATDVTSIYFFGDKTDCNGNDYPLYSHPRVKGYSVIDYHDTINQLSVFIDQ